MEESHTMHLISRDRTDLTSMGANVVVRDVRSGGHGSHSVKDLADALRNRSGLRGLVTPDLESAVTVAKTVDQNCVSLHLEQLVEEDGGILLVYSQDRIAQT